MPRQNATLHKVPAGKRARGALTRASLSSESRAPLYHQIYELLRNKILEGEYARGSYLPGERELGEIFGVSRITTVRALNELAANGLVIRSRGKGTLVQFVDTGTVIRGPAEADEVPQDSPEGGTFAENLEHHGQRGAARVTIHEFEYQVAPADVEAALKLKPGQIVQYAVRAWRVDDKPFNYVTSYVPQDIGGAWARADMAEAPLGDLLERTGVSVTRTHERVTATLADEVLSQRLRVAVNSPLLKITRTSFSAQGRPVEYMIGFYPPDRYQYEVTVPRARTSSGSRHKAPPSASASVSVSGANAGADSGDDPDR
jgi:GntR family transcriptional regulator